VVGSEEANKGLKNYTAANNLTYHNHWTVWPATDHPELENYIKRRSKSKRAGLQKLGYSIYVDILLKNKED
jgi:hypothetical protein